MDWGFKAENIPKKELTTLFTLIKQNRSFIKFIPHSAFTIVWHYLKKISN